MLILKLDQPFRSKKLKNLTNAICYTDTKNNQQILTHNNFVERTLLQNALQLIPL